MQCKKCNGKLEVARSCWRVRLRCTECGHEFQVHEVSDIMDEETAEILANYPSIIYD